MPSLLEVLSEEDKKKVASWETQRSRRGKRGGDVPSELYLVAELGYYYGWPAIEAAKRGYIMGVDDEGKPEKIPFLHSEMIALVVAAQKVKYRKLVEEAETTFSANVAVFDKYPGQAFDTMMAPYKRKAQ